MLRCNRRGSMMTLFLDFSGLEDLSRQASSGARLKTAVHAPFSTHAETSTFQPPGNTIFLAECFLADATGERACLVRGTSTSRLSLPRGIVSSTRS